MSKKKTKVKVELQRRDFLTVAGVALGSAAVAQFVTTGPLSPFSQFQQSQLEGGVQTGHGAATGNYHWGMIINLDKCIGCEYCLRGCCANNDVNPEKPWNIVVEEKTSTGQTFYFSRPCLHCQNAPCIEVCPVGATYHRDDGLVMMDYDRCIGCRYCQVACPYDARRFNWKEYTEPNPYVPTYGTPQVERRPRGVVEKCTFCVQRIDLALESGKMPGEDPEATPACVGICPVGARVFGNLKDHDSLIYHMLEENPTIRLNEELGAEPSVYYIPPKEGL